MRNEITASKKLDIYLKFFKGLKTPMPQKFLHQELIKNEFVYESDILQVVGKLLKDGHIERKNSNKTDTYFYAITFDGDLFYEQGGYSAKVLKDANDILLTQMEIQRRRELDILLAENSTKLNVLTFRMMRATQFAAIAGFLVFAYYILIWIWPHYSDFCPKK